MKSRSEDPLCFADVSRLQWFSRIQWHFIAIRQDKVVHRYHRSIVVVDGAQLSGLRMVYLFWVGNNLKGDSK